MQHVNIRSDVGVRAAYALPDLLDDARHAVPSQSRSRALKMVKPQRTSFRTSLLLPAPPNATGEEGSLPQGNGAGLGVYREEAFIIQELDGIEAHVLDAFTFHDETPPSSGSDIDGGSLRSA